MSRVVPMLHRSILRRCQAKEVLIVHICRHLRLRVCRRVRHSSVTILAMHQVILTNLDIVEDMVIISISMAVEDMFRRSFVPIRLRIAREADIVIIIILHQEPTLAEKPMPSRETRDTGNRLVTVVNFSILMRLPMGQVRVLVRRIVIIPPSISIRKVGAEEDIEICQCFASFEHLLSFDAGNIWILVLGYCECCSTRIILDCTCTAENIA